MNGVVDRVLAALTEGGSCPCASPRFVYWAGKPQGPGWQDNIQNELVTAALRLPFFESSPPASPEYWLESEVRCTRCGAFWKHYCEEWRMMAFQHRLVRTDGFGPGNGGFEGLIGHDVAATAGYEPKELVRLSRDEWAGFMTGGPVRQV
jgi:hypothetical protein